MNKFLIFIVALLIIACAWYAVKSGPFSLFQTKTRNVELLNEKGPYEVKTSTIEYVPDTKGFLAVPTKKGSYPGVVMIHEWWGLNENIRSMAKLLASHGYAVLAVDLYKGAVAKTPEEAQKYIGSLDQEEAIANMKAATKYLKTTEKAPKIASFGWGFGGGQSLRLALSGEKLDATIIYYGSLFLEEEKLRAITWPVLGVFGERDTSVPVESVHKFDAVLTELDTPHEIHIYPNMAYAFANPSDANYAPKETKDAWSKTVGFLKTNLK